jgi:hypothetical protein
MVTIVASAASAPVKALSREPEMALYPVAQVLEPLRLWKLTSDVVSTEHRWIEHLIFLLFAVLPLSQPLIAFSSFFDC